MNETGTLDDMLAAAATAQTVLEASGPAGLEAPAHRAPAQDAVDSAIAEISRVCKKAQGRRAINSGHVVVALAGTTGAGKSSLLNRLTGTEHAKVGVRRPTTTQPVAISSSPAPELLDWLGIEQRVTVPELRERLGEVVLVDLPDIDSIRTEHRDIAGSLVAVVDVMVWVVDPEKYADRILHENYLRPAVEHAAITRVIINQADRLDPEDAEAVRADLHRLLTGAGYPDEVTVSLVSVRTGEGIGSLEADIARISAQRQARDQRLRADLRTLGRELARDVPPLPPAATDPETLGDHLATLTSSIVASTGIDAYARASGTRLSRRLLATTGWPLLRPLHRFRKAPPQPRLNTARVGGAGVVLSAAFAGPPYAASPYWAGVLGQQALDAAAVLERHLDLAAQAGAGGPDGLPDHRRRWPRVINSFQWLFVALLIGSALAYGAQILLRYIGVVLPPALEGVPATPGYPELPAVAWATVLLIAGLLVGAIVSLIAAASRAAAARRHRRRTRDHLRTTTEGVVAKDVGGPMTEMVTLARQYNDAVGTLTIADPRHKAGVNGAEVTAPAV